MTSDVVNLIRISRGSSKDIDHYDFSVDLQNIDNESIDKTTWIRNYLLENISDNFLHLKNTDIVFLEIFSNRTESETLVQNLPIFMFFSDLSSHISFEKLISIQGVLTGEDFTIDFNKIFKIRLYVLKNNKEIF